MFGEHKDLLGIKQLSAEQIEMILERAKAMKKMMTSKGARSTKLDGYSLATLFYENSTRTRLSFEMAGMNLGMRILNMAVATSSVSKGESLIDTARALQAMGTDYIIIRHQSSGVPHFLAKHVDACIINAGDGMHEHPTQALLDLFTIKQHKGRIEGLKVAIVGDITHSRVARSNIWALKKLGAQVAVGAPQTLLPADLQKAGVSVYSSVHEALLDADVVMGLRIQKERQQSGLFPSIGEYSRFFGVDSNRLRFAKPDALVMHPGPVNRGVELMGEVIDGEQSVIEEQITNGVAVRMAILQLYSKKGWAEHEDTH